MSDYTAGERIRHARAVLNALLIASATDGEVDQDQLVSVECVIDDLLRDAEYSIKGSEVQS